MNCRNSSSILVFYIRYNYVIPCIKECLRMMFQSNELSQQDHDCPKLIAQRIQVSEVDSMIDPILQVWLSLYIYDINIICVCVCMSNNPIYLVIPYAFRIRAPSISWNSAEMYLPKKESGCNAFFTYWETRTHLLGITIHRIKRTLVVTLAWIHFRKNVLTF